CNIGMINGTFTSNNIHDVGRDGITSFPLVDQQDPSFVPYPLDNLFISYNKFENVGDDAVAVHAGTEFAINNSLAPSNIAITYNSIIGRSNDHALSQGRGIALTGVRNVTIDSNWITNTVNSGILIRSWYNNASNPELAQEAIRCYNILVVNNVLVEAGSAEGLSRIRNAIHVKGADRLKISSNIIRKSAGHGISVGDTTVIELIANEVYNSQGNAAIVLVGGDDYDVVDAIVADNIIEHWNENELVMYNVINGHAFTGASNPFMTELRLRSSGGISTKTTGNIGSALYTANDQNSNSNGSYLPDGFQLADE
ncbi:MAG: right-handed parallel beta-helix repeat-containing protein, partial [Planctomycetaceae bacterium]|nr:right-handed parallel beta-helix repeat-containing protein [Planctomycetaceae bacterium]